MRLKGSVGRLSNPMRSPVRLEPPGHQREEGENQRRGIFADRIANQKMRRDRAGHLKEDPCVGPFPKSREPRPEQRTYCEDLPDPDNVQDVSWISDGADVLYDKGKLRKVHESARQDFQDENCSACNVDDLFVQSRSLLDPLQDSGFNRYYGEGRCWLHGFDPQLWTFWTFDTCG